MSLKYLKDKNGRPICNTTKESQVFDSEGKSIQTKILELTNTIGSLLNDILETKKTVDDMVGKTTDMDVPLDQFKEALRKVILRDDPSSNICLLKDDNGYVTSDYGYDYKLLSGILYTGRYEEYIKDGDWIELTTADGASYKMYANIDTYYSEGPDGGNKIGHHIDFISKELIYGSTGMVNGSNIYGEYGVVVSNESTKNSYRMNYDTTYNGNGSNNGVSTETSPLLANTVTHRGSEGGIIDRLNYYYDYYIPGGLKSYIIKKYHNVPTRYQSGTGLTDDNGNKWAEMPYLWLPYYKEIWGDTVTSHMPTTTYESHMKQYHSFSSIENFRLKMDKKDTAVCHFWWTASAESGYVQTFCRVGSYNIESRGTESSNGACYYYDNGAPLCFRFTAKEYNINPMIREDLDTNICLLKDCKGQITSDYNYTYDFISDGLYQGDFDAYVRDGDWIELTTNDGATYKLYANVDTYYGEGPDGDKIGHHIDFIGKELIYGSGCRENGANIYSSTNKGSWRMNYDTTYKSDGNANGVANETSPFLANSTKYRGTEGGIIDKLDEYYINNIPTQLKSFIIKKYHKVPTRYQEGTGLTKDNGSKWAEMPYLWIPYEKEIFNTNVMSDNTYESHMKQYHSFSAISDFVLKADNYESNSPFYWWTASSCKDSVSSFSIVTDKGVITNDGSAYYWAVGAPLCFRFTSRPSSKDPIKRDTHAGNICLLKDNNGEVSSDFNYDYEFIANTLESGNYADYIKDGDYIELTTADGATYKMYANVDTYYGYGDGTRSIGHHIDFISDKLIYGSSSSINGTRIYETTNVNTWRMNYDTTYHYGGNNNGVATETSPFLSCATIHRGSEGGIIDKLDDYYINNIPSTLKSYIIKKYHNVPTRYQEGKGLTDDNGRKWAELPYLWIPYVKEIDPSSTLATASYESHMKQYASFANITNFSKKYDPVNGTNNIHWWTASARSSHNFSFCDLDSGGNINTSAAYTWFNNGAPLCFRFASPNSGDSTPRVREDATKNVCLMKDLGNGVYQSDYGYTYDFISDTLQSGNYSEYLKDGDWFELNTADGGTYKMYANIDTYYGEGETGKKIGHHIDFIADNVIYGSSSYSNGSQIYTSYNKNAWFMNNDKTYYVYGNSNGVANETSPFLANSTTYRSPDGGIIDKLNSYYTNYIPSSLKAHIIKKYHKVPTRYQSGTGLTADNGSKWAELPYLWIPYEREVHGKNYWSTETYEAHMKTYHSFINIPNFAIKKDTKDTSESCHWWLASASTTNATFATVHKVGSINNNNACVWYQGTPLCFRFQ